MVYVYSGAALKVQRIAYNTVHGGVIPHPIFPSKSQDDAVILILKPHHPFHVASLMFTRNDVSHPKRLYVYPSSQNRRNRVAINHTTPLTPHFDRPFTVDATMLWTSLSDDCVLLIIISIMMRYTWTMKADRITGQPSGLDISKISLTGS